MHRVTYRPNETVSHLSLSLSLSPPSLTLSLLRYFSSFSSGKTTRAFTVDLTKFRILAYVPSRKSAWFPRSFVADALKERAIEPRSPKGNRRSPRGIQDFARVRASARIRTLRRNGERAANAAIRRSSVTR